MHWHTIETIDKRRPQDCVGTFEPGSVRRLLMDGVTLHKGLRYATENMEPERTVGKGSPAGICL